MPDETEGAESTDTREAAAAAYAEVEAQEAGTSTPPPAEAAPTGEGPAQKQVAKSESPAPAPTDETSKASRERDEQGRFKPGATEAKAAPTPTPPGTPEVPKAAPAPSQAELKAPGGWAPQAREKWQALPPEVQQEVHRRERDMATTLQRSAGAAKLGQSFQQVLAPYEAMIRAEGGEPLAAVDSVMRTAAALRTAPPAHKAQLIANMVKTFNVPVEMLDAALVGQAPKDGTQGAQGFDPAQLRQQILADLRSQVQQERAQHYTSQAHSEVEAFAPKAEFLDDVREDMGDLMEVAARRGKMLTMEQAYDAALRLPHHEGILGVLKQREAAKSATQAQAQTDKAKAASSSVRGQPSSSPSGQSNGAFKDSREAALAAWDEVANR